MQQKKSKNVFEVNLTPCLHNIIKLYIYLKESLKVLVTLKSKLIQYNTYLCKSNWLAHRLKKNQNKCKKKVLFQEILISSKAINPKHKFINMDFRHYSKT